MEEGKPRYKHRYAPGPYGNAVQDTPRTFNEETGMEGGREYWSTRKEQRAGGSHAKFKKRFPGQREVHAFGPPGSRRDQKSRAAISRSRSWFKSKKQKINEKRLPKRRFAIFPGEREKMQSQSKSQEHRIKEL